MGGLSHRRVEDTAQVPSSLLAATARAVGVLSRLVAVALLALVVVRLSGWSSGRYLAALLVALPLSLLPSYALLLVAVLRRDRWLGAGAAALVLAHVLVVLPGLGAADLPAGARDAPRLRVVAANAFKANPRPGELAEALRALHPDVLVVGELTPRGLAALQDAGVLADLPRSTVRGRPGDVEVFSRLPVRDPTWTEAVPGMPQPGVVVTVGGVDVRVHGTHPYPPIGSWQDDQRATLAALARDVRADPLPQVVAGDLNADRDLPPFRDLLRAGLRDAAEERGRGLSRTWPQRLPVLALDHVLVRDGTGGRLAVLDQREASLPGSDHRAVVADLAVLAVGGTG